MPKVKIGAMRSRVEFQSNVKTTNAQFQKVNVWSTSFTLWANIKQSPGLIFNRGDTLEPGTTHIITVREREDITREMRLLNNGNEYTIHSIVRREEGNKRFIELMVEQKDAKG